MLSPNRLSASHRRRSHSASSPIPRRQPDDVKWRISAKRSRPSSIRSPSYKDLAHSQPAEKWDVDQWRRGKRVRRASNTEDSSDEPIGMASDPIFPVQPTTMFTFASNSAGFSLPSTSAAFQFFPQKKTRKPSSRGRISRESSPREVDRISSDEARRMRADALGELHRSVVESGEGLVQKMRDWESNRFRAARPERPSPDGHQGRGSWRRLTSFYGTTQGTVEAGEVVEDDDDDIFIVGEAASFPASSSSAPKKRAMSAGTMDIDMPVPEALSIAGSDGGDQSSSPIERSSAFSTCSSDDEGQEDMDIELSSASGPYSTPALSHTYSTSANSSLVSLPLSGQTSESCSGSIATSPSSNTISAAPPFLLPSVPTPTSHSEKAIAALALAMANGAVGISDYEALRVAEDLTTLDETHAGELWN
ncbi:hypothetical protein BN946_scf184977.g64 [Trametes cinnabarina]|uniref:Uncharacterized protein n=1 Tax=Pycnoporus cinnabarinus TaxID=5643 RepID=A0A060SDU9_PYCCI|nr:hypothetical protein BN946_scf184977.g64 [Trametes cinnabarina]